MAERDPLTQQYLALWELLENHRGFDELVRVGNRPKMIGEDRAPIKREVLTADLPEVRVHPTTMRPHIQRTSNGSSIVCGWQVIVATGDQLVDRVLLPLQWEVYRAMANWASTLQVLTWQGNAAAPQQFVKLARVVSVDQGMLRSDINRGILGWSGIWACETESFFTTASLLEG